MGNACHKVIQLIAELGRAYRAYRLKKTRGIKISCEVIIKIRVLSSQYGKRLGYGGRANIYTYTSYSLFRVEISMNIRLLAGKQKITFPDYMFFIAYFIINATVYHVFKAETAESIAGKPVIQFRIIYSIGTGWFIKSQFVFFSDSMKERSHVCKLYL